MSWLAVAVAAVTLIRLAAAAWVPLAPDETYYWVWSRALAASYLDHPPMVALWIRVGTWLLGQTPLGLRLLGPLAAVLASWMLLDAGRSLFPGTRAGAVAVLMLNGSLLLGVGTVIMTPDSPLLFFWTATLWAMARIAAGGGAGWWLVAGAMGGLALDSKYTALFVWIGSLLWVLLMPQARMWLRRWQPWAACGVGLVLFAPVLAWNQAHHWVGFLRQGGRVEDWRPARAAGFLLELLGSQIALATPLIWALCMTGLVVAVRHAWMRRDSGWALLAALSLPPILVFLQHALGDRVQGNWPAIVYPALTVAAGGLMPRDRWWIGASALGYAITLAVYVQAVAGLIPLPPRLNPIGLQLAGWDGLAAQVEQARRQTGAAFVAADGYALSTEMAWRLPTPATVLGVDPRWKLFDLPAAVIDGKTGLLVTAEREAPPDPVRWAAAEMIGRATRAGSGRGELLLYRVVPQRGLQASVLPRR